MNSRTIFPVGLMRQIGKHAMTKRSCLLSTLVALLIVSVFPSSAAISAVTAQAGPDARTVNVASLIQADFLLDAADYGDLNGDGTEEIVTLSSSRTNSSSGRDAIVNLFAYDPATGAWLSSFADPLQYYQGGGVFIANLTGDGRQQFVAYTVSGSGGFLSYRIFGYTDGTISLMLEREAIFQGSLEARPSGLLERSSDQTTLFTWDGRSFIGTRVIVAEPVPTGSASLHYRVTSEKVLGPERIELKIGQFLSLARDDDSSYSTRIFAPTPGNGVLEPVPGRSGIYQGVGQGQASITIIPRGYDWANKLEVQILVT